MFEWASNYEELFKICTLFNFTHLNSPKNYAYKPLGGYLQKGPQCGLVALAIACENPNEEFVDRLLEAAKKQGFTINGELFSSFNLMTLAKSFLPATSFVQLFKGELDCKDFKQHLLQGDLALVPYDTDKDNSPGSFNGNKSHWAVLCGAIETLDDFYVIARHGKAKNVAIWSLKDISESNAQLYHFYPDDNKGLVYKIPEGGLSGEMGLKNTAIFIKR